MHEAILEDRLDDRTDPCRDGIQRSELRLHVGGKRRVRCGPHVDRLGSLAPHVDFDPVVADTDLGAGLTQLGHNRVEMIRTGVLDADDTASDGAGHEIRAGLDSVR